VLHGRFAAEDRLPPERDLAVTLGVNRVTLRAALGRLQALGLVHPRQGSGWTVQAFARTGGPDLLAELGLLAETPADRRRFAADVLSVRRALASELLRRLPEDPPASARAAVEAFAACAARGDGPARLAEADLDVLAALTDSTGSAVLALCLHPVARVLGAVPWLREALYRDPAASADAWRLALAALDARPRPDVAALVDLLAARDASTLDHLDPDGATP
jgi:DNA-binding FadR family transcriptional regulator